MIKYEVIAWEWNSLITSFEYIQFRSFMYDKIIKDLNFKKYVNFFLNHKKCPSALLWQSIAKAWMAFA